MAPPCGVAASVQRDTASAVAELRAELAGDWVAVFVFHGTDHEPSAVASAVAEAFPCARTAGCTTMGEVGPAGLTSGGMSAFAFGAPASIAIEVVEDTPGFAFATGETLMEKLTASLGVTRESLSADRHLLLTLTDGLSGAEERVVASLSLSAPGLPLVGGSAADDLKTEGTTVFFDGQAWPSATLVVLLEPGVAFRAFAIHHFQATERRVVVTSADPDRRIAHEFDGWPACHVFEDIAGLERGAVDADPMVPASQAICFGIPAGGSFFMRSPFRGDGGSLVMRGAVAEGDVLRVMEGQDLVSRTRSELRRELDELAKTSEPSGMLLFNCGGRLLEARAYGTESALNEAMSMIPAAGFSTYGEQYGALLVNHTLTGVALGSA